MFLSHVHIERFRNFSTFDVSFREGLNVVLGENNIGKTNLFDAVRIALGPSAFDSFFVRPARKDLHRNEKGDVADSFEVTLRFGGISEEDMSTFIEALIYDEKNPANSVIEVRYRWAWNEKTGRYNELRWGGGNDEQPLPGEILQSFPATYLEPLRDAVSQLTGGRANRIGTLLDRLSTPEEREELESLFRDRNRNLREHPLIDNTVKAIASNLRKAVGERLAQEVGLAPAPSSFAAIAQSLRMMLRLPRAPGAAPESEQIEVDLEENGLGYNNLLFVATILAYRSKSHPGDLPLLIVEEPEAHLHPQLQTLLVDYLLEATRVKKKSDAPEAVSIRPPQVFITTHSPVLAAHVSPDQLIVMHEPIANPDGPRATSIAGLGLDASDLRKIQRLLDVTKSTMLFSRGIIFVEGISEQLLLHEFARRENRNLGQSAISVVALHSLGFETILKLFGRDGINIPCAILTDSDPLIEPGTTTIPGDDGAHWLQTPQLGTESAALKLLRKNLPVDDSIGLFCADVTLEYDLAVAADNALAIAKLWPQVRGVQPKKFTSAAVEALTKSDRARLCWQTLCLADEGRYKAAFAHELAAQLADDDFVFSTPRYITNALEFVTSRVLATKINIHETDAPPAS